MSAYHLKLTAAEVDSLCWLVGRFHYAETLWKIMGGVNDDGTMDADLSEHEVWNFRRPWKKKTAFFPAVEAPWQRRLCGCLAPLCRQTCRSQG
jgi:hypothetical protein